MKSTNNFIFITIDKEFESQIVGPDGKLVLDLMSFKDNIIDKASDEIIYNVNQKRINYGAVVMIPTRLTDDVKLVQVSPGLPEPIRYVDHDLVQKVGKEMGFEYECGDYVPEWVCLDKVEPEVRVGDKVYFHYNTLALENQIKLPDGRTVFKLAYQNALCVVRKGIAVDLDRVVPPEGKTLHEYMEEIIDSYERTGVLICGGEVPGIAPLGLGIIPVAGHVLIEPAYDEDAVDIGNNSMGKINSIGLVTEINIKPRPLEGIVRHVCSPLEGDTVPFTTGDRVFYIKNADWEVTVEGKTYYCMKYWDVLAKIE